MGGKPAPVAVGLLGFGTVGSGVVRLIAEHAEELEAELGQRLVVKRILVRDPAKERPVKVPPEVLTTEPGVILDDPEIRIVVEVIGGLEPARTLVLEALRRGKHVVTANKDLMALYGADLLAVAREHGADLYFEASVGGGIPIIRTLMDGFASDRITRIYGIINGTTNYILTQMSRQGRSFDEALREAQALGYAEADPSSDVDGLDAARKMVILATLGFHMPIALDDVAVQGIRGLDRKDIAYADEFGYTVKLLGTAIRDDGSVEIAVQPTLVPKDHPLANVSDAFNAVFVHGEAVGETMFYGQGAGSLPTATAVMSDVVAVIKNMLLGVSGKRLGRPLRPKRLKTPAEIVGRYFFRLTVDDAPGVLAHIARTLSESEVSIERIVQVPDPAARTADILIITHAATQAALDAALTRLRDLSALRAIHAVFRVL
ncbi:homoserine dehydrogenase [Hydrogenibacillus schlegelii]|uniref:Homoserine dehydrogenase n=1 Tax=Hydrogenibacillus schlegelii TaxID=1484 RepID=A0A132NEQ6_HYDSH|nr:homoserine dehydrogenase [Hydrogenibacillus schlegelii]KWX08550.1 homoserine dehydrogenase [Hydrogenibacillus schlegelii]MBT9282169.1 homoserine dehydrogenase [Hydrogenibacillus schlegelii]OAR04197.1 homoserine dehydrogenase [Hydrogenibacillus schlegelii]